LIALYQKGNTGAAELVNGIIKGDKYLTQDELEKLGITSYATGGYTGEFQGAKLAAVHPKEVILNQDDTENILSAVSAVRTLGSGVFSQIEKALDN
jgi:hypothetical protein